MEALVITLREGMEAALVVGLILAYLNRTGRTELKRSVYAGLLLAVLASLAGAAGFSLIGIDPENEVFEGSLQLVAAVLVATLVIWMWRTARGVKQHVESRLAALAGGRQRWGLLAFTFFMVFREGVETVLFLAALSLTAADGLLQLIAGMTGLGLAALFGFLIIRGSIHIDLRRFFGITGLVLLVLVVRLLAGAVHEFSEVGLLPTSPAELTVVGFVVKDSTSIAILMALILVPALAMLPGLRRSREEELAVPGEGSADRRLRVAARRQARRWQMAVMGLTLAVVLPMGWTVYARELAGYRPQPVAAPVQGELVRIATDSLEPGRLHKFVHHGQQSDVRFMVIKRDEGDFAVALDACTICPAVGYHQEGDTVLCENCNAPINVTTIGMAGGCNPVPLAYSLEGGDLVVALGDLNAAQRHFAR
ncbi:MAG: DUF2318 domain-containing protein [Chloroflexi bacterium]|nr:DUF2318 domain-containing protein [Chloroflexota bacterium]